MELPVPNESAPSDSDKAEQVQRRSAPSDLPYQKRRGPEAEQTQGEAEQAQNPGAGRINSPADRRGSGQDNEVRPANSDDDR